VVLSWWSVLVLFSVSGSPHTIEPRAAGEPRVLRLLFLDLLVEIARAVVGFARLIRPTYAEANVGHPSSS
jgi:hypothetical protein